MENENVNSIDQEPTTGEKVVRVRFNVTGDPDIDSIKKKTAALIDEIYAKGKDGRLNALAVTYFETAAMFAVKSLT